MALRAWGITRQNLVTLNNALAVIQNIRNEMAQDAAYGANVALIDQAVQTLVSISQQVSDHLTAEGK